MGVRGTTWRRTTAGLAAAALLSVTSACGGETSEQPGAAVSAQAQDAALPDTPVGRAAQAAIAGLTSQDGLGEQAYAELFSPAFREQVPLAQLASLRGARIAVREVRTGAAPTYLSADAEVTGVGSSIFSVALDEEGRITQFSVLADPQPTAAPDPSLRGWQAVDARLREVTPQVALLAAEVGDGSCAPVHALGAETSLPLGSLFKLVVLDALAAALDAGALSWDDTVTVTEDLKTLPSGALQVSAGEVELSVRDAAGLMVSISDNTATDALIDLLGRDAVEERVAALGLPSDALVPFVSTAELFSLRLDDYPARARGYREASTSERRELLGESAAEEPPAAEEVAAWRDPRWEGGPGWEASAADVCRLYAALGQWSGEVGEGIDDVLSLNDAGLALDPETWPSVWFKGGSEVGVANLAFRALDADGVPHVVVVMAADPDEALPPETIGELAAVARASYALLG